MKRYLFVVNELGFIYSHFWELARSIQNAGWEVAVAGVVSSSPKRAVEHDIMCFPIRTVLGISDPFSELRTLIELRRAVRSFRPDLIHAISLKNVLLSSFLTKTEKVPSLLCAITGLGTMFIDDKLAFRLLRPLVLKGMAFGQNHNNSVMAFENRDDQEYFVRKRVVPSQRSFLIPGSGVSPELFTSAEQRYGIPQILCVARMIRSKGILELTAAAAALRVEGVRFDLILVGDVDPSNQTSLTIEELSQMQTHEVLSWLGKRSDIPALLKSASIFCLPSYREGMSRALVEAAAAGLPIVTTDVPGCREVVVDGVNGYLVPPRDSQSLAIALGRLVRSRELRIRMGYASRERFLERFTTAHALRAFQNCYTALGVPLDIKIAAKAQPE